MSRWLGSDRARRRGAWIALALLCALGLCVRLRGLGFLAPHAWEPDSLVLVRQLEHIRGATPDPESDAFFGYYPQLLARLAAVVPAAATPSAPSTLDEHLAAASAPRLHVRAVIAVLSLLLVPVTYLIARRFSRRGEALLASAFVASSVLHVWFSQQARPHAASCAFAAGAVLAALWVRERNDARGWLLAAFAALAATASLESGFAVLPAFVAAAWLRARGSALTAWCGVAFVLAAVAAGVRVYYPFAFVDAEASTATQFGLEGDVFHLFGHAVRLEAFEGHGFAVVASTLASYEPLVTVLALAGICFAIPRSLRRRGERPRERIDRRGAAAAAAHASLPLGTSEAGAVLATLGGSSVPEHAPHARRGARATWTANVRSLRARARGREDLVVVLAFALPYLVAIGLYEHTYQRFVLPLLPFVAVLAARGLFGACALAGGARARAELPALVACACCLAQTFVVTQLSSARARTDTPTLAARWLEAHVDASTERIVHAPELDLPLWRVPGALDTVPRTLDVRFPWIAYQRTACAPPSDAPAFDLRAAAVRDGGRHALLQRPEAYLAALDARWLVVAVDDRALGGVLRAAARANGTLAARFSPWAGDGADATALLFQDDDPGPRPRWWTALWRARRTGPVVEIWSLRPLRS